MQNHGLVVAGKVIPNVTVTTFTGDAERRELNGKVAQHNSKSDATPLTAPQEMQMLNQISLVHARRRMAQQGAEEVRLFAKEG